MDPFKSPPTVSSVSTRAPSRRRDLALDRPPAVVISGPGGTPRQLPRAAARPTGPRLYKLRQDANPVDGPGLAPPGFVSATTSWPEWVCYYWLWIVLGCDGDPRQPPFVGDEGGKFRFQKAFQGGRVLGGSVIDFTLRRPAIAIRLQGEWQHQAGGAEKLAKDVVQKGRLAGEGRMVIDIFEQHLLTDPQRRWGSAHRVARDATNGIEWGNPVQYGTFQRVRFRP